MNIVFKLGYKVQLLMGFALLISVCGAALLSVNLESIDMAYAGYIWLFAFIFGVLLPFMIFRSIKCPKCKHRIFWEYFNGGKGPKVNPLTVDKCPFCDFDPFKK